MVTTYETTVPRTHHRGREPICHPHGRYAIHTDGCPEGVSPCLGNGRLRISVDSQEENELLRFSRQVPGGRWRHNLSASKLEVECRQLGGGKTWARMCTRQMLEDRRHQVHGESFEDWILKYDHMVAPGWCAK